MKNLIRAGLMSAAMVVLMCGGVFATDFVPQGSCSTPMFAQYTHSLNFTQTELLINNITGSTVYCKVTVYDQNGNDVSSHAQIISGPTNGVITVVSTGNEFDIPAHGSRQYVFSPLRNPPAMLGDQ
ncbi:hypothetical protein [Maridesulfovibrio sp. FT414]|uniref:hypothetical protein n=1 Tax=Maridesulfovibrio sp. FT414 TaxID=2979469 RepID=UPI003D802B08